MPLTDYLAGLAWFLASASTVTVATVLVTRRWLGATSGEARLLAVFLVATTALVGIHLVPLMLGILTRATPAVAGALLCLVVWRLPAPAAPPGAAPPPPAVPAGRGAWFIAVAAVAAAAVAVVAYTAAVALLPFTQVDLVGFHLPGVARWIQSGSLWQIDQFLAYQAQGNYPNTGDVVHLAVMLPWHYEFAVHYVALPFVAATGVAVYAVGRELGAPAPAAATFAAAAVTVPSVAVSNLEFQLTDAVMYATFVTGVLFLLRHVRAGATLDLVLAGVGLGLAFGVKWYAVSSVAVVLAVWLGGLLLARRPWRRVLADAARLVALVLLLGGVWMLRNWVESGNPVFPQPVRALGVTIFGGPFDVYRALAGFRLLDYIGDPDIWRRYAWPAFNETLGAAWIIAAVGALTAAALAGLRGRQRDGRVLGVAVAAALLAVVYTATPYSALGGKDAPIGIAANTRYVVPALLLALAVSAWTAGRLGRAGPVVQILGLVAVGDGLRRSFAPVAAKHVLAAVGLLAAAALLVVAWRRWARRDGAGARRHPAFAAGTAAVVLLLAAAGGYAAERRFTDHRYPALEAPLAWTPDHHPRRVGLTGLWDINGLSPVYPSFGPRLANRVDFVGPFRDGLLSQYRSRAPFVSALRRGHYDLLLVGLADLPGAPRGQDAWARSAGWVEIARSPRLVLLRPPEAR
jgi:hypothetical protein